MGPKGYVKPKKWLGQHFLIDLGIAKQIADGLQASEGAVVLEIGPGTGVLTQFLVQRPYDFYAIEIDDESIEHLHAKYPNMTSKIIKGDFLDYRLENLTDQKVNIIGNFPYNISSQIFFRVLQYKQQVHQVVCMLQKEVAKRLAAGPGTKDYGILSVFLQAYYDIEYLFTVDENVFNPPPKVKSGVIRLVRNQVDSLQCNNILFNQIVKMAFNQRRKTMRNSIKQLVPIGSADIPFLEKRPEQLSVAQFVELTLAVEKLQNASKIESPTKE